MDIRFEQLELPAGWPMTWRAALGAAAAGLRPELARAALVPARWVRQALCGHLAAREILIVSTGPDSVRIRKCDRCQACWPEVL